MLSIVNGTYAGGVGLSRSFAGTCQPESHGTPRGSLRDDGAARFAHPLAPWPIFVCNTNSIASLEVMSIQGTGREATSSRGDEFGTMSGDGPKR